MASPTVTEKYSDVMKSRFALVVVSLKPKIKNSEIRKELFLKENASALALRREAASLVTR